MLNIPRNNEIAHVHFLCIDRHSNKKTLESSSLLKNQAKMSFSIDSIKMKIKSWVDNKNKTDFLRQNDLILKDVQFSNEHFYRNQIVFEITKKVFRSSKIEMQINILIKICAYNFSHIKILLKSLNVNTLITLKWLKKCWAENLLILI